MFKRFKFFLDFEPVERALFYLDQVTVISVTFANIMVHRIGILEKKKKAKNKIVDLKGCEQFYGEFLWKHIEGQQICFT